ncbi:ATP-binding protein [Streptomyces sp. CAU 1734]|uniref:ATP-binding protein n=1 Tax=Streptomyces sp. CAU 1734 TaxID=3140360 RepID=UPI0032614CBA
MPSTETHPRTNTVHHPGRLAAGPPGVVTAFDVSLRRTGEPGAPLTEQDRAWPGLMRRIGRAHLRMWKLDALLESAELVLSELVTNGYTHGRGRSVGVRLWRTGTHVGIEVNGGGGPSEPRVRRAGPDEESGRGLLLVSALADAWGVTDDGARTWCLLSAEPRRP